MELTINIGPFLEYRYLKDKMDNVYEMRKGDNIMLYAYWKLYLI